MALELNFVSARTNKRHHHHECTACPAFSSSPEGASNFRDCICDAGYTGQDGGPCVACAAGTYKNATGNASCLECVPNTHAAQAAISAGRVRSVLWAGIRETQTTLRVPHAHTGNTRVFLVPLPVYHVYSIHSRFPRRGAQSAFVARGTFRKTSPWSDRRANRARQTHTST